jgi:dihydrofolate synthase/folylpolyglutamate synthase
MTYQQTIAYLYTQLPVFTRVGASAYKANLDNTIELCNRLDNPQHKFKSVHIAGTNGKGSTSHMLAAVLQVAGYKTGLYTSPHLKDFRERIRINGEMISEQSVVDFVAEHKQDFEEIQPSFFEMTVGLAFEIFAKEKIDIAVIETGLGRQTGFDQYHHPAPVRHHQHWLGPYEYPGRYPATHRCRKGRHH